MYPNDVPHHKKDCTPIVPHSSFGKPHFKINSWQPCPVYEDENEGAIKLQLYRNEC